MSTIVRSGVVLGVLVAAWTFMMGFTGWYKHPVLLNLFFCVIPIQILLLIWAVRKTAAEGRGYGGQVLAGTLISAIGGVLVVGSSLLFTMVVFPNYFREIAEIQERMLREAGLAEADIRATLETSARGQTPMAQALAGFLGTLGTGLLASLVIAVFVRAKRSAAAPAA